MGTRVCASLGTLLGIDIRPVRLAVSGLHVLLVRRGAAFFFFFLDKRTSFNFAWCLPPVPPPALVLALISLEPMKARSCFALPPSGRDTRTLTNGCNEGQQSRTN